MNTMALMQAMKEKEMISLITELMKYRERRGKEKFQTVLTQMQELLKINTELEG